MSSQISHDFYERVACFYDAENAQMDEDLPLYSRLVAEVGGPVLDVGCGTGRVTLHLAQEGVSVVGVDYSQAMLDRAARKLAVLPDLRTQVTWVHGDLLDINLDEHFSLIVVPYNGFMHFKSQAVQIEALERLRGWLRPGGLLVIDLPNPGDFFASADDGALVLERTFEDPESGHLVMQQSMSTLDRAAQVMYITWIYDAIGEGGLVHRTVAPLTLRYVFPAELDLLLRVAGMSRVDRYGDYDGGPFQDTSPRLVVLARSRN